MKIVFVILFFFIIFSCKEKNNIFQIDDKEEFVVESSSIGCFHSEYYVTRIIKNGLNYNISFNEFRNTGNHPPFKEYLKEYKLKEIVWNQKDMDLFIQTLKTDTSKKSTTQIHHTVINKNDTLKFWESTGSSRLLINYYNTHE